MLRQFLAKTSDRRGAARSGRRSPSRAGRAKSSTPSGQRSLRHRDIVFSRQRSAFSPHQRRGEIQRDGGVSARRTRCKRRRMKSGSACSVQGASWGIERHADLSSDAIMGRGVCGAGAAGGRALAVGVGARCGRGYAPRLYGKHRARIGRRTRSEEHTSELQSRLHLVCRLLLEKKKKTKKRSIRKKLRTRTTTKLQISPLTRFGR